MRIFPSLDPGEIEKDCTGVNILPIPLPKVFHAQPLAKRVTPATCPVISADQRLPAAIQISGKRLTVNEQPRPVLFILTSGPLYFKNERY
jgi:hypothetical protein